MYIYIVAMASFLVGSLERVAGEVGQRLRRRRWMRRS
jgi:hypothetical protein